VRRSAREKIRALLDDDCNNKHRIHPSHIHRAQSYSRIRRRLTEDQHADFHHSLAHSRRFRGSGKAGHHHTRWWCFRARVQRPDGAPSGTTDVVIRSSLSCEENDSLPPPQKTLSHTPRNTTTTCSQLMREMNTLLRTDYAWDPAWIDGVTAAIRFKRLDTSVAQTKAAIDYLVSKSIPVHRVENMVSINKQILARTVAELKETVEYIEGKGLQGDELARFLETNPVVLRWVLTLLAPRE